MELADPLIADLHGAVPAFDIAETGMLDYRTPDMFQDGAPLSLDAMVVMGPDMFRIA